LKGVNKVTSDGITLQALETGWKVLIK
jgi:hypothetical protein